MAPNPQDRLHHLRGQAETLASALPPLLLEAEQLAATVLAGVHGRRRAGPGETFWQYRPYVQGDSYTQIDWRQSARVSDRLYVRQQEWEVAATLWIWCDAGASLDYASSEAIPTKRWRAQILATALASLLARAGERIGLAGSGRRPFIGRRAPELFAEKLLGMPQDDDGLPPQIETPGHKRYVLISDFYTPIEALEERLKSLALDHARAHLIQVVDPSEEDFPFSGRTEFLPTRSGESPLLFGNAGAIANDYARIYRAHRGTISDLCTHYGWTFSTHRTDHPAQTALAALYRALMPEVV